MPSLVVLAPQLAGRDDAMHGWRELLKVDVVLRGSVRRASDSVSVTAQLIETASDAYLWSETYDRDLTNVLSIQEGIACAIVAALQLTLVPPRAEASCEARPDAYTKKVRSIRRKSRGMPVYRLEELEHLLGIPLPASTQWEIVEEAAEVIQAARDELIRQAAQGDVLHNDDTSMRVLHLAREPSDERTGVFVERGLSGGDCAAQSKECDRARVGNPPGRGLLQTDRRKWRLVTLGRQQQSPERGRYVNLMFWLEKSFWALPVIMAGILASLVALVARNHRLKRAYQQHFVESRRERLFLAFLGFFVAAGVVRGITFAIHHDIGPFNNVTMRGRHIHHLVWGILLLLAVGYSWLVEIGTGSASSSLWAGRLTCILYGTAAALTLDEFALWLNLRDVYWEREGRESVEAMAVFGGLLGVGVFGRSFFRGIAKEFAQITHRQLPLPDQYPPHG
jgi:hypothetical protein